MANVLPTPLTWRPETSLSMQSDQGSNLGNVRIPVWESGGAQDTQKKESLNGGGEFISDPKNGQNYTKCKLSPLKSSSAEF